MKIVCVQDVVVVVVWVGFLGRLLPEELHLK